LILARLSQDMKKFILMSTSNDVVFVLGSR